MSCAIEFVKMYQSFVNIFIHSSKSYNFFKFNSKLMANILFILLLSSISILSIGALTINTHHESYLSHNIFNQNLAHYMQVHSGEIPDSVFNELTKYVQSDK